MLSPAESVEVREESPEELNWEEDTIISTRKSAPVAKEKAK
jgi:hypothetical protein